MRADRSGEREERPNIIFVLADDLGYRDLGCYGQPRILTPNIDRMAAEGVRFTQCYAGSPVCAPSRSVLMTGQHTGHTRVRDNFAKKGGIVVLDNGPPQRRVGLEREDITVAQILKEAGYATGITGKWGLAEPGTPGLPTRKGFDEWFGYLNQRRAHTYYPPFLWRNEEKVLLQGNQDGGRRQYSHDMFTDFALDFIRRHADEPFFLYLPYTIPHQEYDVPDLGPYGDEDWPPEAKAYAAMVSRLDRDVGRIMEMLRDLGIYRSTVTFLSSDNGAARTWDGIFDSGGRLRGTKGSLYEGGIRTPMVVHWPGHFPPGVSDAVWYFADFLPTAAELARAKPPEDLDGVSVLPTLLGREQRLDRRCLYWEYYGGGFQQAVRFGNWKAIRRGERLELYDLARDLGETNDLAEENLNIVRSMLGRMDESHTPSKNWPV